MDEQKIGVIVVSFVATAAFALVLAFWVYHPPSADNQTLNVLVGALTAGYLQTLNYWFGSSSGSKAKDKTISNLADGTKP